MRIIKWSIYSTIWYKVLEKIRILIKLYNILRSELGLLGVNQVKVWDWFYINFSIFLAKYLEPFAFH